MAKKYLDENGLAYFWSKVKQYLATPTRAGLMSPTDKAKVDAITNQGTIAYYRKLEGSYTTISTGEYTIPIPITSYSTADILLVDINGLDLVEGVDYTISGTNIVLATPISVAGQTIHFIALRATTATSADYSILKGDDGDVSDVLVDGNSVVNQQGIANISIQSLGLIDVFYPVGSYYETSDTTFDPNTAWGGTWESETIQNPDYIVEQYHNNVRSYRIWKSGKIEAWGHEDIGTVAITTSSAVYGGYRSNGIGFSIGAPFTKAPYVVAQRTQAQGAWLAYCRAISKTEIQCIFAAGSSTSPTNQSVDWYAWEDPSDDLDPIIRWHRTA